MIFFGRNKCRQVNKYGNEAFGLFWGISAVTIFIKAFILDLSFTEYRYEYITWIVVSIYYLSRCVSNGIFMLPTKSCKKRIFTTKTILLSVVLTGVFGALFAIRNTYLYLEGNFGLSSIIVFIFCWFIFLLLGITFYALVYGLSNRQANKDLDEIKRGFKIYHRILF